MGKSEGPRLTKITVKKDKMWRPCSTNKSPSG